jgi:GH25 family lysozyme M1 (1,4-beta-N-acetylmuramidase)
MAKVYSFAILECGIGNDGKSSVYEANKSGCVNAGMSILPYHFLYCLPTDPNHPNRDPESQAILHYSYCNSKACADLEFPVVGDWNKWGISNTAFFEDWVNRYQEKYKSLCGEYCILYTYPYFMQSINNPASFAKYKLWIASYAATPTIPTPWQDYVMWQYSSHGTLVNGAPVDLDSISDLSIFS